MGPMRRSSCVAPDRARRFVRVPPTRRRSNGILAKMVNAFRGTAIACAGVPEFLRYFLSLTSAAAAGSPSKFCPVCVLGKNEDAAVGLVAYTTRRTLVELFATTVARSGVRLLEVYDEDCCSRSPFSTQPAGADSGRCPCIDRFLRGHRPCAGRLLWRFILRVPSLFVSLRLRTLPLRPGVLCMRLLAALPHQFAAKPCLRASLPRTAVCRAALCLASSSPSSLRLQPVRLSILVEAVPVGRWRCRAPLANAVWLSVRSVRPQALWRQIRTDRGSICGAAAGAGLGPGRL